MSDKSENSIESWERGPDDLTIVCDDFHVEFSSKGYVSPCSMNSPIRRYFMPLDHETAYILRLDTDAGFVVVIGVVARWVQNKTEPEPFLALEAEQDPEFLADQMKALRGQKVYLTFRKRPG